MFYKQINEKLGIGTVCMYMFVNISNKRLNRLSSLFYEALESVMWDDLKIRSKRRIATRSGKGKQPLNIKTAVERPILKLRLQNFRGSFYFILLLVVCLLFRRMFMTSHITLSSASYFSEVLYWSFTGLLFFFLS